MIEKRISFKLSPDDFFVYDGQLLKTASVNLPGGIPYDPNFLYLEVRAVSAGEYYGNNKNIDFFPEEQLNPRPGAGYGKETFLTAHVFKNHDNKDVANAIGDVLKATWDDEMKGVNLLIRIDKDKNTSISRGFELGYITDVSMGCRVHHVVCSICGHKAKTKADYCTHLKNEKGTIYPDGRKVQEINIQPKFHDISIVLNGAEKVAKVLRIYRENSNKSEKVASWTQDDMTKVMFELGISKTASLSNVDGMLKTAGVGGLGAFKNGSPITSNDDALSDFLRSHIENVNKENLEKIALEQEFDKVDQGKNAFKKLATLTKLSEFEKRLEGEIIRASAKNVEKKMDDENKSDKAFTEALNLASARSFKELDDEALDSISKELLKISEEKRIPRFEVLRTFFTVLAVKGINLTLSEFAHLTLHVLKGMDFEGDHKEFERKINDYRSHLTDLILSDIKRQEIFPGVGLFNARESLKNQGSPLGENGLDKMIMAIHGSSPFGRMAIIRRPMVKIASYQDGETSPAGICGSEISNNIISDIDSTIKEHGLYDRILSIEKQAKEIVSLLELEKTASDEEVEKDIYKVASLMADTFMATTSLMENDFNNMDLGLEVLAGYKAFIDEVYE